MRRTHAAVVLFLLCPASFPLLAQVQIGGDTCDSTFLNGSYEIILSGRQVTATGAISKTLQSVGTAAFDGLSKVTFTLTANTNAAAGTPLVYSGTYSLQANCVGAINITSGDTATFTVQSFNNGGSFSLIGTDATYAYTGGGNLQPASCQTSMLSGVHEFASTGNLLSGTSVSGTLDVAGVLTFDGKGNLTASWTQASNTAVTTVSATGTYSVTSGCLGSASLTDTSNNKYAVNLAIYSSAPDFSLAVASPQEIFNGYGSAAQPGGNNGTCSASMLNGSYELSLPGRQVSTAGVTLKVFQATGVATFDGISKVTLTGTANTNASAGNTFTYSGTYTLQSNCHGSINITTGNTVTLAMVAFSINTITQQARAFSIVGADANYAYNGSGNLQPTACSNATLSGLWNFMANGSSLSSSSITGTLDAAGVLQFDGQGNVTANWTETSDTSTSTITATGTYTVTPQCRGTATLTDTANGKSSWTLTVFNATSGNFLLAVSKPQSLFLGTARTAFQNPGQRVVNAASYAASATPPGSVFALFGLSLSAPPGGQPTMVPLPGTFQNTTVTVNGEPAPLFYVSPTQINAQMPYDIQPGLATVMVKNGTATSNAVAVEIPAAATPGIVYYGNNRAVVVDASKNNIVNTTSAPASVGDFLVAYFTGGGPVTASGPLVTGAGSPGGLSPVAATTHITVAGVDATIQYIGLTPGGIGLYQANFQLPKVAAGDRQLVITIGGKASNSALIAVQ